MKMLSIKQPWAELVVQGIKNIENRSFRVNYRGPLLIHAAKSYFQEDFDQVRKHLAPLKLDEDNMFFGAVIGIVDLIDVKKSGPKPWFEGPFGWYFKDAMIFVKPVPYKGKVGIFNPDTSLLKKLKTELKE